MINSLNDYRQFLAKTLREKEPRLDPACRLLEDLGHEGWRGFEDIFNSWVLVTNRTMRDQYERDYFEQMVAVAVFEVIRRNPADFLPGVRITLLGTGRAEVVANETATAFMKEFWT